MSDAQPYTRGLVWLRRDLRVHDHAALYHALKSCRHVHVCFIFDVDILKGLPAHDRRVAFIHASLRDVDLQLRAAALGLPWQPDVPPDAAAEARSSEALQSHSVLIVRHGRAQEWIPRLAQQLDVQAVFCSHDDEPTSLARDHGVRGRLAQVGVSWHSSKDAWLFERNELLTGKGQPYTVFTPYKKAWLAKLDAYDSLAYASEKRARQPRAVQPPPAQVQQPWPELQAMGFEPLTEGDLRIPSGSRGAAELWADFRLRLPRYHATRDFPAVKGPSYLGMHLRFGTVSIRQLVRHAMATVAEGTHSEGAAVWLSELIWRDFYAQILFHHPHVALRSFKPAYDAIVWEKGKSADADFKAWCQGLTGYPLVDAAQRQLLQTGYMHNRLRMVSASFLVKDLGIDWRWGERFFALHLNDYELSSNNGGWQWAASTGCDAQPWFRIFNPVTQSEKFDPEGKFIRRYVPELAALPDKALHAPWLAPHEVLQAAGVRLGTHYPLPRVDHAEARERTLARYAVVRADKAH